MKILIVEDEKNIAQGIHDIIKRLCPITCTIYMAYDGQEACDSYMDSHIDLVITDIRMQQMNGLDMIEKFSRHNPSVQYLIISGYDNFSYAQRAIRFHVVDYLLKPVDKEALLAAVQAAYDRLPESYQKKLDHRLPKLPYFEFQLLRDTYPASLKKLVSYLQKNYMTDISLQSFAQEYMMNPNYLSSLLKKYTDHNFSFLLDYVRVCKAAEFLLYDQDLPVSEISYLVGYNHERRLYQAFQKRLGCTPGEFRNTYSGS